MSKIRCKRDNCKTRILNQNKSKHAKKPRSIRSGAFGDLMNLSGDAYLFSRFVKICATWARVAVPVGSRVPSALPLMIFWPTAHCKAGMA